MNLHNHSSLEEEEESDNYHHLPSYSYDQSSLQDLINDILHHRWDSIQTLIEDYSTSTNELNHNHENDIHHPAQLVLWYMVTDPTLFPTTAGWIMEEDPNYLFWRWLLNSTLVDINLPDEGGETAILKASALGISKIVVQLLTDGADITIHDKLGRTPLSAAAAAGHAVTCLKLIKLGKADPNQTGEGQIAPLCLATIEAHLEVVRTLLSNPNIYVDPTDQFGWTPLMLAAYLGHGDIVELLLSAGANRFTIGHNNKNAMNLATDNGHLRIARRLDTYRDSERGTLNLDRIDAMSDRDEIGWDSLPHRNFLVGAEVPDDISLDSDDQLEIQRKLDRQDTIDSVSHSTLGSDTTPTSTTTTTLRSRRVRNGTLTKHLKNTFKGRSKLTDIALTELDASPLLQPDQPLSNLSANPPEKPRFLLDSQSRWELFSKIITICCFPALLTLVGRMKDRSVQQAWREKVALVFIIIMISLGLGFLTFGFSSIVCHKVIPIFPDQVAQQYGASSEGVKLMSVRGQLYDTGSFFPVGNHRPILPFMDDDLEPIIEAYYGNDISIFFPPNRELSQCKFWPTYEGSDDGCKKLGKNAKMHCHTSKESLELLKSLSINNYVAFSWQNISSSTDKYFVFNELVFSLTEYLDSDNKDRYFGEDLDPILTSFIGRDATKDILRHPKLSSLVPCFEDQFLVGKLDGTTIGCFASNLIMIIATSILLIITIVKFTAAMAFDWFLSWKLGKISVKHRPKSSLSYIMLLVTCYSEGENSLRTTLDSLAYSDYDDDHKLLFVIADGDITGSGNAKSTPDLLLDMLEPFHGKFKRTNPKPRGYTSIGDGAKQMNMAKVHMGHYVVEDRRVPFLLIIKCGVPNERTMPKAGNRGKRDSQLILMRWLSAICFNDRMSPLDYELTEKARTLCGVTPDKFEMVLMVDADTIVLPDAVSRMVAAMERDPTIMGLCGETKITNKRQSWVTKIQVYEYYISHHLGKAFESIFGGVTCLPGCFCMYRIKVPKPDGYAVPILANPDIVANYSSNDVSTLHKKNLLLLGEDRYLTTLMLRAFPKRKMIYVPKAICKTVVPDEFSVLLSQRRRWINSTVHNLLELVLVPQLCGIFCCSMQFVIFLELLGTVVMPASLIFLIYLIVGAFIGKDVALPLLFMAALFLLQAILIVLTTRKFSYIFWMLIYIVALPVWNFVLPAYSFWRFDDFSWGATRKINGPDDGHTHAGTAGPMKPFPKKRWSEWQQVSQDKRAHRESQRRVRVEAKADQARITRQQALVDKQREHFQNHLDHMRKLQSFQMAQHTTGPPPNLTMVVSPHYQPPRIMMTHDGSGYPNSQANPRRYILPSPQMGSVGAPLSDTIVMNPRPSYSHRGTLHRSPTRPQATLPTLHPTQPLDHEMDLDLTSLKRPRGPRPKVNLHHHLTHDDNDEIITTPLRTVGGFRADVTGNLSPPQSPPTSPTLLRQLVDNFPSNEEDELPPTRLGTLPRGPRQDLGTHHHQPQPVPISRESDDDDTDPTIIVRQDHQDQFTAYLNTAESEVDRLIGDLAQISPPYRSSNHHHRYR